MKPNYIIKRLIIEIVFEEKTTEQDAMRIAEDIKQQIFTPTLIALEKQLDMLAVHFQLNKILVADGFQNLTNSNQLHSKTLKIDRFEIPLMLNEHHSVSADEIERDVSNAITSLIPLLDRHLAQNTSTNATISSVDPITFELTHSSKSLCVAFIFYLQHGYLLWNTTLCPISNPETTLAELLSHSSFDLKQQLLQLPISAKSVVVQRFMKQFTQKLIEQLILLLAPAIFKEFTSLVAQLKNEVTGIDLKSALETLLESALRSALMPHLSFSKNFSSKSIREQLVLETNAILTQKNKLFFLELTPNNTTIRISYVSDNTSNHKSTVKIPFVQEENTLLNPSKSDRNSSVLTSEHFSQLNSEIDASSPFLEEFLLESEGVFVSNAGLILAWPYLAAFFRELKVLDETGLHNQEKALLLLHYLCFGNLEDAWEHSMFLNKLLCGWDFEKVPMVSEELSDDEKQECDELIKAIIENWGALKNTSVEGFREAFFQREGIVTKVLDNWLLRIERKGYDVMLDQLNWGINTIKFSWNDHTLFVEW